MLWMLAISCNGIFRLFQTQNLFSNISLSPQLFKAPLTTTTLMACFLAFLPTRTSPIPSPFHRRPAALHVPPPPPPLAVAVYLLAQRRSSVLRRRYRRGGRGGAAEWTLEDVASWELQGCYRDPTDPRRGTVELYMRDGQARMVHSEYGPVPEELRVVTKELH